MQLLDAITEAAMDAGDIALSKIRSEQILKRLNELMPEAMEIGKLRLHGYHDDEIDEIIGLNRTTFRSRLEAVRKKLSEEFGDDFEF